MLLLLLFTKLLFLDRAAEADDPQARAAALQPPQVLQLVQAPGVQGREKREIVCVCVCKRERQRERNTQTDSDRERDIYTD